MSAAIQLPRATNETERNALLEAAGEIRGCGKEDFALALEAAGYGVTIERAAARLRFSEAVGDVAGLIGQWNDGHLVAAYEPALEGGEYDAADLLKRRSQMREAVSDLEECLDEADRVLRTEEGH